MSRKPGIKNRKTLQERFMEKVNIEESGCWNFKSKTINPGFHVDVGVKKTVRHVAWFLHTGDFGCGDIEVTCNNPYCVNPAHLVLLSSWEDRFWLYTDKKGEDDCWNWKARKDIKGYGILNVAYSTKAHRLSWLIHYGEIPDGMFVCHKCDNTSCVNPNHLFLGTAKDNNLDKIRKGRGNTAKGERNFGAILSEKQVITIRFLYSSGKFSTYFLSDVFQVSRNCISRIVNNITWRHLS